MASPQKEIEMTRHELNTLTSKLRQNAEEGGPIDSDVCLAAADELERQRRLLLSLQDLIAEGLAK